MLPPGSRYMAALNPANAWSDEYVALMDIKEAVVWCLLRIGGYQGELPEIVVRPWEVERRALQAEQASKRSKQINEQLNSGNWEAV